jgi:hypothetical protein
MRVFDHPNLTDGWTCPICGKADDKPVVLIVIAGTQDGNIAEAEQFHLECLEPEYVKSHKIIIQVLE